MGVDLGVSTHVHLLLTMLAYLQRDLQGWWRLCPSETWSSSFCSAGTRSVPLLFCPMLFKQHSPPSIRKVESVRRPVISSFVASFHMSKTLQYILSRSRVNMYEEVLTKIWIESRRYYQFMEPPWFLMQTFWLIQNSWDSGHGSGPTPV